MADKPRDAQPKPAVYDPNRPVANTDQADDSCDEKTKRYWADRTDTRRSPMPELPGTPPSSPPGDERE